MHKKLKLAGAFLLAISSLPAYTADKIDGWIFLTNTNNFNFYGKERSLTENKGIRSIIIQEVPISKNSSAKILYSHFTIPSKACKNEFGEITMYEMSGKVAGKYDYVKGGSSAAAYIADLVCGH
ncbi:hypothetical protein RJO02_004327 [Enterobacter hormaechei]|uniref:hypothetical protein n=1 Tax=Enterobacter hormaechei TaxID=158836 RepID=UPI001C7CD995|nr:hypothetical protein [Enterobacter hormaechei]ELC6331644.1 hypothetical protein [Enterobacter hormaechei]